MNEDSYLDASYEDQFELPWYDDLDDDWIGEDDDWYDEYPEEGHGAFIVLTY